MPIENKNAYPLPRPYRQGQLDSLCGIYAIINACRVACKSFGFNKKLNAWEMFTFLLDDLDEHRKLGQVICYGMGASRLDRCLKVAQKYLLGKHKLHLTISRPLAKSYIKDTKQTFKIVRNHLQKPGTSVLLEFEAAHYEHWTVISGISNAKVHFTDSDGLMPKSIGRFHFKTGAKLPKNKNLAFSKSALILLQVAEFREAKQ